MLFNSFDFGVFLIVVYLAYWGIGCRQRRIQNLLLLLASYFFYGLWDWRFLMLLLTSSLIDFTAGHMIQRASLSSVKKAWLWGSIAWNLGVLITFKYFNFFVDSFTGLFSLPPPGESYTIWSVIIPLGLSFYTFQTMSYTIDVYRKKIQPAPHLLEFLCFVSFFPQLVAGPIERAKKLLPQFETARAFNLQDSKEGLRQILWGLFKKVLVADTLGIAVSMVFDNPAGYAGITLVYAAVLFCFQVYCDFSGYTDIAIGTARLFGFKLSRNFDLPYLARSITEFWQRWHITLTQWFTDYVYIPFLRSIKKVYSVTRALGLIFTMLLVGLWHGANWTFIAFGAFNGCILAAERLPLFLKRETLHKKLQEAPRWITFGYFFLISSVSAVFFRAESIAQAFFILKRMLLMTSEGIVSSLIGIKLGYLVILLFAEILTRHRSFPLQRIEAVLPKPARWFIYYMLIFMIIRYAEPENPFIYFQF